MQNVLLVLLSGFYLAIGQRLYFTQYGGNSLTAFYKFNVQSPVPAPISGSLGLLGVSDVTDTIGRGLIDPSAPNVTLPVLVPMGIATTGNSDTGFSTVVGGREWLYISYFNDTNFQEVPTELVAGFQVRSVAIASGARNRADTSVVYLGLWSLTEAGHMPSGIYSINGTDLEMPRVLQETSPCPDGLALSMDRQTLFWTDVCDGTIYSKYMSDSDGEKAEKQVIAFGLIQPKGIAFNGLYNRIYFVANYVVYTAWLDGRAPNITGPTQAPLQPGNLRVIIDILGTGIVAPIALTVEACDDSLPAKVYWSDACNGKIRRASVDGTDVVHGWDVQDVITGLDASTQFSILCDLGSTTTTTTSTTSTTSTSTSTSITTTNRTNTTTTTTSTTKSLIFENSSSSTNYTSTSTTPTTINVSTTTNITSSTSVTTTSKNTTTTTTTTTNTTTFTPTTTNTTTHVTVTSTNWTTSTSTTTTTNTTHTLTTTTTNTSTTSTSTATTTTSNSTSTTQTTVTTSNTTTKTTATSTNISSTKITPTTTNTTSTTVTTTTSNATTTVNWTTTTITYSSTTTLTSTNSTTTSTTSTSTSTTSTSTTTSTSSTTTKIYCSCSVPLYNLGASLWMPKHAEVKMLEQMAGGFTFDSDICTTTTTTTTLTSTTTVYFTVTTPAPTAAPTLAPTCYNLADPSVMSVTGGAFVEMITTADSGGAWFLDCEVGRKVSTTSNVVDCIDGVYDPAVLPTCELSTEKCALENPSILDYTVSVGGDFVSGTCCETTCTELDQTEVPIGTTCLATCNNNVTAVGTFTCGADGFQSYSYCIAAGSEYTTEEVVKINGGLSATFDLAPTVDDLKYGFCSALLSAQNCKWMFEVTVSPATATTAAPTTAAPSSRRLLLDADEVDDEDMAVSYDRTSLRRLQTGVTYNVDYTVAVPTAQTAVDSSQVLKNAEDFSNPNGTTSQAFISAMAAKGKTVSNIVQTKAPTAYIGYIVKNANGDWIDPNPPPSPAPATKKDDSSNVGVIIGACLGGLVGLAIFGGCAYYFLVMKRKAEA